MSATVVASFRTAVGGFHKGDVMNYISQNAAKQEAALQERDDQLLAMEKQLEELREENARLPELEQELESLRAALTAAAQVIAEQEAVSESASKSEPAPAPAVQQLPQEPRITDLELAAYRRAESTERLAQERARRMHMELTAVSSSTHTACSDATEQVRDIAQTLQQQISSLEDIQNQLAQVFIASDRRIAEVCGMNGVQLEGEQ